MAFTGGGRSPLLTSSKNTHGSSRDPHPQSRPPPKKGTTRLLLLLLCVCGMGAIKMLLRRSHQEYEYDRKTRTQSGIMALPTPPPPPHAHRRDPHTKKSKQKKKTQPKQAPPTAPSPPVKRLPNVLIIGAQKAGTTAIAEWLYDSGLCKATVGPDEPEYYEKETHFFDHDDRYAQGVDFYARLYQDCWTNDTTPTSIEGKQKRKQHKVIRNLALDATPNVMLYPDRVHHTYAQANDRQQQLKKLKLIMVVREPTARELSIYNHKTLFYLRSNYDNSQWYADVGIHNRRHPVNRSEVVTSEEQGILTFDEYALTKTLEEMIQHDSMSLYAYHVHQWMQYFRRDQLLVLNYDEFKQETGRTLGRIRYFLDIPPTPHFPHVLNDGRDNKAYYKNVKVFQASCNIQYELSKIFNMTNDKLYHLLASTYGPVSEQRPFQRFTYPTCLP